MLAGAATAACTTPPEDQGSVAEEITTARGTCDLDVGTSATTLVRANASSEYALTLEGSSTSVTSWAERGNEAVVLEVLRGSMRVGHLVLHQGRDRFIYGMHVGALNAGEDLRVRVSPLTAPKAQRAACLAKVKLTPIAQLGDMADGVEHAPIIKWPIAKSFDDLPVLLGWSRAGKSYQLTYTNENGGTTSLCGGGARGLRSEIARWGRGLDMEGVYGYGGRGHFERCDGVIAPVAGKPRMHEHHPVLYYGDGHNRLFESRSGYGQTCGDSADTKANGDLEGWNVASPGDQESADDPFTIVIRPLPVDMDAIGAITYGGRREGIVDTYAPWLYRLTDSEVKREGKVDNTITFDMSRYLFVDVYASDVDGSGDATCPSSLPFPSPQIGAAVQGGFVVRAVTKEGVVSNGPQMTASLFGGSGPDGRGPAVKRIAIRLAAGVTAKDITSLVFDAYDNDGIYLLALGDAFVPRAAGTNGASLDYVHRGMKPINVYVDDDNSGCVAGRNTKNGVAYPCAGSLFLIRL